MSNAKPMSAFRRAVIYTNQEASRCAFPAEDQRRPMTPAQRRRIKHKNHKILGAAGGGTVKPKHIKNRQSRPAPVAGGLLRLLNPSQIRKRVAARSEMSGIKFKLKDRRPDAVIIDDEMQRGKGDR